jgi:hypothetical protein
MSIMKNLNTTITILLMAIMLFMTSALFAQNEEPAGESSDFPISSRIQNPEFIDEVSAQYPWKSAERSAYEEILGAYPRFNIPSRDLPFSLTNIDQLRQLKDMLDLLPTTGLIQTQSKKYGDDGPVGVDPCANVRPPFNPQTNFNKVLIDYKVSSITPIGVISGPPPSAFDIKISNICPVSTSVALFVGLQSEFGFGTNMPQSKYHFAVPNFQIGDNTTLQFKIDNINNSLIFSKVGNQLFKVDANGKVWAREFEINLTNPFPDYVFEADYKLMPINDLETFIIKNKHLPNVKPASEYQQAGSVNIGELNIKMMEKIEELTLYIISQQHNIEELTKEVQALKNK